MRQSRRADRARDDAQLCGGHRSGVVVELQPSLHYQLSGVRFIGAFIRFISSYNERFVLVKDWADAWTIVHRLSSLNILNCRRVSRPFS